MMAARLFGGGMVESVTTFIKPPPSGSGEREAETIAPHSVYL